MAIFGTLEVVMAQVNKKKFERAFSYLKNVSKNETLENKRLLSLANNAFEKIELDKDNFALEQVYISKEREACFFESHKQYIDVQYILEGEEIIEVASINDLPIDEKYNQDIDLLKYKSTSNSSIIKLRKGDVAVFFPEDAHMPCVKLKNMVKVIKTVVKVAV